MANLNLPADPVLEWEDITLNFEAIQAFFNAAVSTTTPRARAYASGFSGSPFPLANGSGGKVVFGTGNCTLAGGITTANGADFVVPVAGTYRVMLSATVINGLALSNNAYVQFQVLKNGAGVSPGADTTAVSATTTLFPTVTGFEDVTCVAGDVLACIFSNASGVTITSLNAVRMLIARIDGNALGTPATPSTMRPTAKVSRHSLLSFPAGALNMVWDTLDYTTGGMTSSSSGITVPVAGIYSVKGSVLLNNDAGAGRVDAYITVNGVASTSDNTIQQKPASAYQSVSPLGTDVKLNAGDVVSIQVNNQTGSAINVYGDSQYWDQLSVHWVSSLDGSLPVQPAGFIDPFNERIYRVASFALTNGAWAQIPFDTIDTTIGNGGLHMSTVSGGFVVPVAGTYDVTAVVEAGITSNFGLLAGIGTAVPDTAGTRRGTWGWQSTGGSNPVSSMAKGLIHANVNDVIKTYAFLSGGGGSLNPVDSCTNYMDVRRVG